MSKKYAKVNVVNGKTQELTEEQQNCEMLCVAMFEDEKDKRIAELEEQLKNAIMPKFKIGKICFALLRNTIEEVAIVGARLKLSKIEDENFTMYSITDSQGYACSVFEEQLFMTREEAEARLKEMMKSE